MGRGLALIGLISACLASVTQPATDLQLFEKAVATFREGVALAGQPAKARVQFRAAALSYEALRAARLRERGTLSKPGRRLLTGWRTSTSDPGVSPWTPTFSR